MTATTSTSAPITLAQNPTPSLVALDENAIRTAILTQLQADFAIQGIQVNVEQGSDYYNLASAFARELAVVQANAVVQVDNFMPDSTQDPAVLARYMALVGLAFRGAFGAAGFVTIQSSQPSPIEQGAQLVDGLNQVFFVTQAGTYTASTPVPVQGLSVGSATEHVNGDVLQWVVAPPFCQPTVTVGTTGGKDGLVNGGDAEDIETARARYMVRVANPMGGGNAAQVAGVAAASYAGIQSAFVYDAANGPATVHVAVTAYATNLAASNARNRDVASSVMTGTVTPYVQGQLAEYSEVVVTTVANVPTDVAVGITIPSAPTASPAGPGGGWVDGLPWPYNSTGASSFKCTLTSVTSPLVVTCDAPSAPVAGVSSIAYLDPSTWRVYSAHVVSFTGTSGAYVLTLDAPLVNVVPGAFIWPQSQNQMNYVNALLSSFAALGPGEKTASAGLLPRAFRKPLPASQYPYALNDQFVKPVTNSGTEVVSSKLLYTSIPGWPSVTTPALPVAISNPPNQFVPRWVGIYPA